MPFLKRLQRIRLVGKPQQPLRNERNRHRRRIADGLGENPDHVVEVRHRAQAAIPPRGIGRHRAVHHARLVLESHARMDRGADDINAGDNGLVKEVVRRVAERRREHHRTGRARLVVVVHDLREPGQVHPPVHVRGLVLVRDVEVAVVVVADVLLVEARDVHPARLGIGVLHVPVGDELHAVRVRVHEDDDHVVQNPQRLSVVPGEELIVCLDQLVGAQHLRRMQSAVNPDDRLPLFRELPGSD